MASAALYTVFGMHNIIIYCVVEVTALDVTIILSHTYHVITVIASSFWHTSDCECFYNFTLYDIIRLMF